MRSGITYPKCCAPTFARQARKRCGPIQVTTVVITPRARSACPSRRERRSHHAPKERTAARARRRFQRKRQVLAKRLELLIAVLVGLCRVRVSDRLGLRLLLRVKMRRTQREQIESIIPLCPDLDGGKQMLRRRATGGHRFCREAALRRRPHVARLDFERG